jgi:5-methylthioadenosine/S-adenosylhomocysteine deaminase
MDKNRRVIENGAIAVQKGEIVFVGTAREINQKYSSRQIVNARNKIVIPGLINAHTHIPMTLFRGIADDLDLQEWLTKYIFPAEAKNVTEDFVRVGTRLGLAEMIRGGTTAYCDMYYFEDAIADETFKAGVRGVLGETIIRFPVADNKTPEEALRYSERFVNKWKNNALIVPALAPHAPYTLTTEQLQAVKKLADKLNAAVVIHVAETQTEVDEITKQYGARPVEYLEKIGFLNNRTIAAHVVYANENEVGILKNRGVGAAHNPQSNMKLASGVAPVPLMLARDVRLGLGTDGAASNNDLSMWEEMDAAAKLHKLFSKDPKVVTAEQAFMMATVGGARALHLEDKIGSLETGKRADIVIVDFDNLHQTPMYNVYSHLVYATKASDVRHVIINGVIVMRDRNLLTLNESVIKKDANLYREKIIKSLSNN